VITFFSTQDEIKSCSDTLTNYNYRRTLPKAQIQNNFFLQNLFFSNQIIIIIQLTLNWTVLHFVCTVVWYFSSYPVFTIWFLLFSTYYGVYKSRVLWSICIDSVSTTNSAVSIWLREFVRPKGIFRGQKAKMEARPRVKLKSLMNGMDSIVGQSLSNNSII